MSGCRADRRKVSRMARRLPQIDITNDGEVVYAVVKRRMVAFMWRVAEYWYVAAPGKPPTQTTSERDAVQRLMAYATEARS